MLRGWRLLRGLCQIIARMSTVVSGQSSSRGSLVSMRGERILVISDPTGRNRELLMWTLEPHARTRFKGLPAWAFPRCDQTKKHALNVGAI